MQPCHGLTDLPAAWLVQLTASLDSEACLALFRSCRALRDLILAECRVRVCFRLPTQSAEADNLQAQLNSALKLQPSSIQLRAPMHTFEAEEYVASAVSASKLLSGAMACVELRGQPLTCITRVELQKHALGSLVPAWLLSACPNLTSLRLDTCHCHLISPDPPAYGHLPHPDSTPPPPAYGQLKELHLTSISPWPYTQSMLSAWQHQLQGLTGLTSLTLTTCEDWFIHCLISTSHPGPQLTSFSNRTVAMAPSDVVSLAARFPCLTQLDLSGTTLDDQVMEALLSLQHLTHVTCGPLNLQRSYRLRPCNWTLLSVEVYFLEPYKAPDEIALLPSGGLQSLHLRAKSIDPISEVAANMRLVEALTRPGVTWESYCITGDAGTACLLSLLPILATYHQPFLKLTRINPVTPQLLTAMAHHLARAPASRCITNLTFYDCSWHPDVWPTLLPTLPHTRSLTIHGGEPFTEADITAMCVNACRPVSLKVLQVCGYWEPGWWQRVEAAMGAAGHQHVKCEMYGMGKDTRVRKGWGRLGSVAFLLLNIVFVVSLVKCVLKVSSLQGLGRQEL